jgi:MFS family permease
VVFAVPAAQLAHLVPSDSYTHLGRPVGRRVWPRALAALSVRDYRLFLGAQTIATTGLWMQRIAQDWLVFELSGSVAAVGIAVALQFLPVLIFGLISGVLIDRFPKRVLLLITQSSAAALAVVLGVLALTGAVQVWHVYLIATLLGFVTVVDNPTRQVFVAELVGDRHLGNAVSLNSSVFQLGALLGPALSGVLITAVGQGWSFLINAASCLVVVAMLLTLRPLGSPTHRVGNTRGQLRAGLETIRQTTEVAWAIVLVAIMGVLGLNMPVILTAFAESEFALGVSGYSLFNSLTAIGALAGALLSARRREVVRLRVLVMLLTGLGIALVLGAIAPTVWLFAVSLVATGLLTLLFLTGANSMVQMATPPSLRGRVMSVYILVLLGGQAVGGPLVGRLIDLVGARPSMSLCGGLIAVATLAAGVVIARRSNLRVDLDLHRDRGRAPMHIVPAH